MPRPRREDKLFDTDFQTLTGLVYKFVELEGEPVSTPELEQEISRLFTTPPHNSTVNRSLIHLRSINNQSVGFSWMRLERRERPCLTYWPTLLGLERLDDYLSVCRINIATMLGGVSLMDSTPPFVEECMNTSFKAKQLVITSKLPDIS